MSVWFIIGLVVWLAAFAYLILSFRESVITAALKRLREEQSRSSNP